MYRLLICLPLCLLLSPASPDAPPVALPIDAETVSKEPLPGGDVLAFLEKSLDRYRQARIETYRCIFQKQERIDGKLQPSEETEVFYRAEPYSVWMHWLHGARQAATVLYVAGANGDKMIVHPAGPLGNLIKTVKRDPEGPEAKQAGRYTIKQFGIEKATERVLSAWKAAKEKGTLHVEYLGIRKVHEAGDRLCYTLRRTCATPEEDGVTEIIVYIDKENGFQVGTVLKGEEGKLIGEYMFRDISINTKIKSEQFTPEAVTS